MESHDNLNHGIVYDGGIPNFQSGNNNEGAIDLPATDQVAAPHFISAEEKRSHHLMTRNKAAFMEILEDHKLIIFKICNSYCRDREEQKDLVQEVIMQLWSSFPKYNPEFKLSTWVYRIALNVAISNYRKSTTRSKHLAKVEEGYVDIAVDDDRDSQEDMQLLREFINQLDELNRALMILYLDGNSHEEIAAILNISKSNVGTKINRIKEKLKKQFKDINHE